MKISIYAIAVALGFVIPLNLFAADPESIRDRFKNSGYLCTDSPEQQGYFCIGDSPKNYVVIPRGVNIGKFLFYAHGLVRVCQTPGASGEDYLKNEAPTLRRIGAVAVMPYRESAADTGFPLGAFVQRMGSLVGGNYQ